VADKRPWSTTTTKVTVTSSNLQLNSQPMDAEAIQDDVSDG